MSATALIELALMRASVLLDSDPAAAAQQAAELITQAPHSTEAQLLLAAARRKLGDPAAAVLVLERLCASTADVPSLQLELGRAYAAAGRGSEALAAFRRAVALDEALADGWRELAATYFAAGDVAQGDHAYAAYCRLVPDAPELADARVALADNRLDAAADLLKQHLQRVPNDAAALRLLAEAANRFGNEVQAERYLRQSLELAPGYAQARADLAGLLSAQQRSAEALPLIERLLAQNPDHAEYLSLKAQTLRLEGRTAEGIAFLRDSLARQPGEAALWLMCGHLLRETGKQPEAIEAYRRALELRPTFGQAYWGLADLKTFHFTAAERAAMQEQLARPSVRGEERVNLEFALGKALEDEAQYESSFEHYARGNALQLSSMVDHVEATSGELERAKTLYTKDFFSARADWGSERTDPIFIVGVPRSGSTLLEQILSSHTQIEGTRELMDMVSIVRDLAARSGGGDGVGYTKAIAQLTREEIAALAARYLERTQRYRPLGRARFVDKMLGNYANVGLIHLMFPRAVIIDARRHPLASTFSCYKQLFGRRLAYTYGLEHIAKFYRGYHGFMEHFDTVLPGRVYRVHYEQLIADPEAEVRQLLSHCGVEFEAQCLRFYENPRAVMTVSSEQVRRPIYTDSLEQWRHYEPWLGSLKQDLGDLAASYPPIKGRPPG